MTSATTILTAMWLLSSGADWSASFVPAATGSYLEGDAASVLVAAAGEPSPELSEAAKAVAAALRASGRAKLVMDDSPIAPTTGLSDEQIVQKCKALPVQQVVVVRVFPGADAAHPSAVVTFYDKQGKATTALAAVAGTPIPARESAAAGGVSGGTMSAVDTVTHRTPEGQGAQQKYDEQYIWFEDITGITSSGQLVGAWSFAYEGKYKRLLSTDQLLRKLGREDLAREHASREGQRWGLLVGGTLLGTLGAAAIVPAALFSCTAKSAQTFDCVRNDYTLTVLSGVAAAAGLGMTVYGAGIKPAVDVTEVRRMADDYNKKLKRDLGLAAATRRDEPAIQVSLGPAGLSLSGTF